MVHRAPLEFGCSVVEFEDGGRVHAPPHEGRQQGPVRDSVDLLGVIRALSLSLSLSLSEDSLTHK